MAQPPKIVEPTLDPALFDIRHVVDIGLQTKAATRAPRTNKGWTAGSLGYCLRRQFYDRAEIPTEEAYPLRTFWVGDLVADGLKNIVSNAGLLIREELHLTDPDLELSGYVDMIWGGLIPDGLRADEQDFNPKWQDYLYAYRLQLRSLWPEGFPITGDEVKTANDYSARKMQSEGPQLTHRMQAASYALILDRNPKLFEESLVERWRLSVIDKSDAMMLVFDIKAADIQRAEDRVGNLNTYWKARSLPPCTCGVDISWEKAYCKYKDGDGCCDPHLVEKATSEEFWQGIPDVGVDDEAPEMGQMKE